MWLLENLKLGMVYIIFLVDRAALYPLHMVELWFMFTVLCFVFKTENMRNSLYKSLRNKYIS